MKKNYDLELEKQEQIARGKRIKDIRENELRLSKTDLAKLIGISSQFLGLVEEGKGNLVYRNIKTLRRISGHSSDYILFGFDDTVITKAKEYLQKYTDEELINAFQILIDLSSLIKKH